MRIDSNPQDEINRFCLRICILPYEKQKLNYVWIRNKGFHSIYETFEIQGQSSNPAPLIGYGKKAPKIYEKILEKYSKFKKGIDLNSHYVFCT